MRGTRTVRRTAAHLFEFRTAAFEVPAGVVEEFVEAGAALADEAACRRGTRLFTVLRDCERPRRFLIAAVFDDADAERALFGTGAGRRFAAILVAAGVESRPVSWEAVTGL